jgi:NAD(P)-dependent dehydrogenase (short-subunit alcohol dehydrogenase family)
MGLAGRSAIVSGAAQGIGFALARRLIDEGMHVTLLDRNRDVIEKAGSLGRLARGRVVDLRDVDEARTVATAAVEEMGGVWLLVNNAGVFAKTPVLEIDPADWDTMMEINVRSMLLLMQAVAPAMQAAGGGRIVNQASMAAKLGTPGEAHYAASKAAVVALTRIASQELGPDQITVNSICPGYVLTEMGADTRDPRQIAEWTSKSPLGRLATPDDVAASVVFLASDEAGYITGEALNVSGGMCTW